MSLLGFLTIAIVCSVAQATVVTKVNFTKTPICPSSAMLSQLSQLTGSLDKRSCFVDCAVLKNCSVVFSGVSEVCYFGTKQQLDANFSSTNNPGSAPCESHVRTWEWTGQGGSVPASVPTAGTGTGILPNMSSVLLSKLVIFLDFRQSYTNLVNPSKYNAAANGAVVRNSSGAYFPGNSNGDYIEVDTDGKTLASTYLAQNMDFTIYAKLFRQGSTQTYHYFYDCVSTTSRGIFFDAEKKPFVEHLFPSAVGSASKYVSKKATNEHFSSSMRSASVGVRFSGGNLQSFFVNGNLDSSENGESGSYSNGPLCLRLGYNPAASNALNGRFVCYIVANALLSESELQQLEGLCAT